MNWPRMTTSQGWPPPAVAGCQLVSGRHGGCHKSPQTKALQASHGGNPSFSVLLKCLDRLARCSNYSSLHRHGSGLRPGPRGDGMRVRDPGKWLHTPTYAGTPSPSLWVMMVVMHAAVPSTGSEAPDQVLPSPHPSAETPASFSSPLAAHSTHQRSSTLLQPSHTWGAFSKHPGNTAHLWRAKMQGGEETPRTGQTSFQVSHTEAVGTGIPWPTGPTAPPCVSLESQST